MKNKANYWRNLLNQVLILLIMGGGLLMTFIKRDNLNHLAQLSLLKYLFIPAFLIYFFIVVDTVRALSSSYLFQPFDPADPDSLEELARQNKYRLFKAHNQIEGVQALVSLLQGLKRAGYREVSRQSFGIVTERQVGGKNPARMILIYKPMLNVIIAERHLKEASDYILNTPRSLRYNSIVLISDMESDSEMLSSAVSVVNFLPKLSDKHILMPYVLDLRHGRLFSPQDRSEQGLRDRAYYRELQEFILEEALRRRPSKA